MPDRPSGPTSVTKHSLTIAGHRTSISLEAVFWADLRAIAGRRGTTVAALVGTIDAARGRANLSSAIRVFVLDEVRHGAAATHGGA